MKETDELRLACIRPNLGVLCAMEGMGITDGNKRNKCHLMVIWRRRKEWDQ